MHARNFDRGVGPESGMAVEAVSLRMGTARHAMLAAGLPGSPDDGSRDALSEAVHRMDVYEKFGPTSFAVIERRLARGTFIAPAELALALEANPDVAPPPAVRDYLIRTLRGEVTARRGREPGGITDQLRDLLAVVFYERNFTWLSRRKKRDGQLKGWAAIRSADWWHGPPHERAARMVARALGGSRDWRHIVNLASRLRRGTR